jgi:ABC-type Mn2+/Zn2+ transport system permease subunit
MDALLDPFQSGIGLRALAEIALLGCVCGALSFWIVAERLTYGAESLAHGLLPGVVAAALIGAPLLGGAAAGVLAAALLVALAGRDERIGADTATAVVVSSMLGLGALLAMSATAPPNLERILFGDLLAVGTGDLVAAGALVAFGGAALVALHRPLAAVAFDPAAAPSLGISPTAVRLALLGLLAAALAVAVQGLGNLLVLAVLVAPAVAVRRHARGPGRAALGAAVVAVAAGIAGYEMSAIAGGAAGACVALALCLAAAAGSLAPGRARGRLG